MSQTIPILNYILLKGISGALEQYWLKVREPSANADEFNGVKSADYLRLFQI